MLEKDIIRNVLLHHHYLSAQDYAGKYVIKFYWKIQAMMILRLSCDEEHSVI